MNTADLQPFFEDIVRELRGRGVLCGITSGMACVYYDVALGTKDCDLLCHESCFDQLLSFLGELRIEGAAGHYRGHLSPPLDARWHRGGWTSHFQWGEGPEAVTLDVFGRALRGSVPWEQELNGLYVSPHVVSEMKRTNRDKDWPFINLLGRRMLLTGDARGWLHLYGAADLREMLRRQACPSELQELRPALKLAVRDDARLEGVLRAERALWERLDEHRIELYRRALRPYVVAVGRAKLGRDLPLKDQHSARLELGAGHLALSPLVEYGLDRHVAEARRWLVERLFIAESVLEWLPDVARNYNYLTA